MTFVDFLDCCLCELDTPYVEIIFTIAWMLWIVRNELMWDGILSMFLMYVLPKYQPKRGGDLG